MKKIIGQEKKEQKKFRNATLRTQYTSLPLATEQEWLYKIDSFLTSDGEELKDLENFMKELGISDEVISYAIGQTFTLLKEIGKNIKSKEKFQARYYCDPSQLSTEEETFIKNLSDILDEGDWRVAVSLMEDKDSQALQWLKA
jgi:hypothetical protein